MLIVFFVLSVICMHSHRRRHSPNFLRAHGHHNSHPFPRGGVGAGHSGRVDREKGVIANMHGNGLIMAGPHNRVGHGLNSPFNQMYPPTPFGAESSFPFAAPMTLETESALQDASGRHHELQKVARLENQLKGEIAGGGLTAFNMGGASNEAADRTNYTHSPISAAVHESGPFGPNSPLSMNLKGSPNSTVQQRAWESNDQSVHNDKLKVVLQKIEKIKDDLARENMNVNNMLNNEVKKNAQEAAHRDKITALKNAEMLAVNSRGGFDSYIPGQNRKYGDAINEQLQIANHANEHERNIDLYEFEDAARMAGSSPPTEGKRVIEEREDDIMKENLMLAKKQKTNDLINQQKQNEKVLATNALLEQEKNLRRDEEMKRFVFEADAKDNVNLAVASSKIAQANQQKYDNIALRNAEEIAANRATGSEIRNQMILNADAQFAANAIQNNGQNMRKNFEEHAQNMRNNFEEHALAVEAANVADANLALQNKADEINENVSAAGEFVVARNAIRIGDELLKARNAENLVAENARAVLAKFKDEELQARSIAKLADNELRSAVETQAKLNEAFQGANVILGTIPDDADKIDITNSSITFPMKTFQTPQAHNQAEAAALAEQIKAKDELRGKITPVFHDTPLNVIKGEGGYLNIPENAEKIEIENGRVYFTQAGVAAMKQAGQDISQLEHRINIGERANISPGIGYYVANVNKMTMDVPSPGNPTPAPVITGNGHVFDVSHAEGLDIKKGTLSVDKWNDYSRGVRPTVHASILTNLRNNITESIIDDDCVRNAIRDADTLYNTKSELITNENGETYLKVTPPYGVSQQIPYDDAIFNLKKIQESCKTNKGQSGVSIIQGNTSSSSDIQIPRRKSFNIQEGVSQMDTSSEENKLTNNALQEAATDDGTHRIVKRENAFDNQTHAEKNEIVEEGERTLAEIKGVPAKEFSQMGKLRADLKREVAELRDTRNVSVNQGNAENSAKEKATQKSFDVAYKVKESMIRNASNISADLHISEEEYINLMGKVSMNTLSKIYDYVKNPNDAIAISGYEKAQSDLRILFGLGESTFEKVLMKTVTNITGVCDPNEQVLIRKETTYEPKLVNVYDKPNPLGGNTTVKISKVVPITHIIKIPFQKVTNTNPNRGLTGNELPSGERIRNSQFFITGNKSLREAGVQFVGPHSFNNQSKIKLGLNGMVVGTNQDIKNMIDSKSIGNINSIAITSDDLNKKYKEQGNKPVVPSQPGNTSVNQIQEVTIHEANGQDCIGPNCKVIKKTTNVQKSPAAQISSNSSTSNLVVKK